MGGLGAECQDNDGCASPLICLQDPFTDGYCGNQGCDSCTDGVCANALGAQWCLKPCMALTECRSGYLCQPVGPNGQTACVPPCMMDMQCGEGEVCGMDNRCVPAGSQMTSTGGMTPTLNTVQADEGCVQGRFTSSIWLLLIALLGMKARRVRLVR